MCYYESMIAGAGLLQPELGPAHCADHGVVLAEAERGGRAVAQLRRRLAAHAQPLVRGRGGARAVRVHAHHRELNVLHLTWPSTVKAATTDFL